MESCRSHPVFLLQTTGEALSSTIQRRWRRRATYWKSWRSSVCLGPGGPRRGITPPGPSPRCSTYRWTDITLSPETSDPPLPPPCSPTGCWPTTMIPALLSEQTLAPFAPSTSTRFHCTQLQVRRTRLQKEEGHRLETATPKAKRRKVETGIKKLCSRCIVLLAGVGPCCRRFSVQL